MNINEILKSDYDLLCKDYKKATKKIERLRQENTQIGMLNADLEIYLKEHKERIDKAIEYIENFKFNNTDFSIQEILDILKGDDKE